MKLNASLFQDFPTAMQNLRHGSTAVQILAIAAGTLILTISSYAQIPMLPVPITMQTLAVTMIGALYGWRLGAITVLAWLAEAAAGAPVLAGGAAGFQNFLGPTGGYLIAFPLVGGVVGVLTAKGWDGQKPALAFISMLIANLGCLGLGAAWLALFVGFEKAIDFGMTPFLMGALLKSALGAALLVLLGSQRHRR